MKTKKQIYHRLGLPVIAWLTVILFACSFVPVFAKNSAVPKGTDICVIYDNSRSTYQDETWCRYKYILEILATSFDYKQGGQLLIYPLCDVSLDGRESSGSREPIYIRSYADIGKIKNLFTTAPAGTSFAPVEDAWQYLTEVSSADRKKLLILTDGLFDGFSSEDELRTRLHQMATCTSVDIYYLSSDKTTNIKPDKANGLNTYLIQEPVNTQQVLDLAGNICGGSHSKATVLSSSAQVTKLNLTGASRVLVCANGSNATISGLTDSDHRSIPCLYDTGRHQYSTTSAVGLSNAPVDPSLESYISIFDCTNAGEYTLECQNSEDICIYVQYDSENPPSISTPNKPVDGSKNSPWPKVVLLCVPVIFSAAVALYIILKKKSSTRKTNITDPSVSQAPVNTTNFVFISYSTKEVSVAEQTKNILEANGIRCWMAPKSIPAGSDYGQEIPAAIESCKALILILSEASQKSHWVPKEVGMAIGKGKIIIPFQIDDSIISEAFNFYLTNSQRISAYNRMAEAFQELTTRARNVLAEP
jgi:hypothetical protein